MKTWEQHEIEALLDEGEDVLTSWEVDFLEGMCGRDLTRLSAKQRDVLEGIQEKINRQR